MHRPCFALGVFFTVFAGSLFIVSPSRAQTPALLAIARANANVNENPDSHENLATDRTGYDSAYDSAMFDDECRDAETDESLVDECIESDRVCDSESTVWVFSGPSTSLSFDDRNCCVDNEEYLDAAHCTFGGTGDADESGIEGVAAGDAGSVNEGDWDAGASEDGEADGSVGASASACEDAAFPHATAFIWHTVHSTMHEIKVGAQNYWLSTWPSIIWQRSDTQETWVWLTVTAQDAWESTAAPTYAQQTYSEEIVLLHIANTLDTIGDQIHDAAHFIRYKAADRIVSKGRRIANRQ